MEGDRFVGMHFAMGDQCGRTERRVDVSLFYLLAHLTSLSICPGHIPVQHHV